MSNFNLDIQKLRELPIEIDIWKYKQIGKKNEGSFKKNYQDLKVIENSKNKEKLIEIDKFGLSGEDYYLKGRLNKKLVLNKGLVSQKIFLRKSHAERLARVDKYLREKGLFLFIVSGWRHPELQKMIKEEYARKFGKKKADRMYASTNWNVPAPHCTGAAFDIELRYLTSNKRVETDVYFRNEKIHSLYWAEDLFKQNKLTGNSIEAVKNRRIIYHTLCTVGIVFKKKKDLFVAHPGEYWHYGDGDVLSSFLKRRRIIKYGIIYPNNFLMYNYEQKEKAIF